MKYPRLPLIALALIATSLAYSQYTATILNPMGASVSRAWCANNGHQVGSAGGTTLQTAALWSGTAASAVPLTPPGWDLSYAFGIYGNEQVGAGNDVTTGFRFHALRWSGTAASYLDLHPTDYSVSVAYASDGTYQAGQATTDADSAIHAMLWSGSAGSATDLNPASFSESHAYGAWNGRQVGLGTIGGATHALLWSGSAGSAVDLNGAFDGSEAFATDDAYQVGDATGLDTGGATHAIAWSGAADAWVDLNPIGLATSVADGIGHGVIAGYGAGAATGNVYHAFAWLNPNAASAVDLHAFLPAGYRSSYAYGVDAVTGDIVGEAVNSLGRSIAVMWTPDVVPEPASLGALAAGLLALRRRKTRA